MRFRFGSPWSILLIHQNFTNWDRVSTGQTGTIAVYEARLYEARLCTAGCHRPRRPKNDGLSVARAKAVSLVPDCFYRSFITGFSCRTALNSELLTSICPL